MTSPARVQLPALASPAHEVWDVLLDLAETTTAPWTLVGGQMVLLHALERGVEPPQISQDGDVVGDVRSDQQALRKLVDALEHRGFQVDGMSPDGLAHRYRRRAQPRDVLIDVLAPEGLGANADLTTTRPGRTLEVPGGTQALHRTERVLVAHGTRAVLVPRPTLLGALVGKGAACALPGDPARHLRDLALLCAVVDDPYAMADELTATDRRRIRQGAALRDPAHRAWTLVPQRLRRDGHDTFDVLTAAPQPR